MPSQLTLLPGEKGRSKMSKNEKMVYLSLLVAQALILGMVERMLPVPFICPGAKLGLANIITVIALYRFDFTEALTIVILRVVLLAAFGGSVSSFLYSLSGGLLSLLAMYLTMKLFGNYVSTIGVSVIGGIFHNIGQIIVASLVVQNIHMLFYFPILIITGIGTGIFVGITSRMLLSHLRILFPWRNLSGTQ